MTNISVKMIRALFLAGLLSLSFLMNSCSHLEKIVDDLFSDKQFFQEDRAGKRIPLPPTTKDFESDLSDR